MDEELVQVLKELQTAIAGLNDGLAGIGDGLAHLRADMTAGFDRLDGRLARLHEEMAATRQAVLAAGRGRERMGPPPPPMTAERARDLARTHKAMAAQVGEVGMPGEAARFTRESEWWLARATELEQAPPKGE